MNTPDPWTPYVPGTYQKQEYDLQLKDGRELLHYWPNAGRFARLCDEDAPLNVPEEDVAAVRFSIKALGERASRHEKQFTWNDIQALLTSPGKEAPSESEIVFDARNFSDWEAGFNCALEIIERRAQALLQRRLAEQET